jgi:hypothetical protein
LPPSTNFPSGEKRKLLIGHEKAIWRFETAAPELRTRFGGFSFVRQGTQSKAHCLGLPKQWLHARMSSGEESREISGDSRVLQGVALTL